MMVTSEKKVEGGVILFIINLVINLVDTHPSGSVRCVQFDPNWIKITQTNTVALSPRSPHVDV